MVKCILQLRRMEEDRGRPSVGGGKLQKGGSAGTKRSREGLTGDESTGQKGERA